MLRPTFTALALLALVGANPLAAQQPDDGQCQTPDSIAVTGNRRVPASTILLSAGLQAKTPLNYPSLQRAIRSVFQGGQFDDVQIACVLASDTTRAMLVIKVQERPLLGDVDVAGPSEVPLRTIKDKVDLIIGRAVDPAAGAAVMTRIDSVYQANGFYLARVKPETTTVGDKINLLFRVEEGRRLAISGVQVIGNTLIGINTRTSINHGGVFVWGRSGSVTLPDGSVQSLQNEDILVKGNTIRDTVAGDGHIVAQGGDTRRLNIADNVLVGSKAATRIDLASNQYNLVRNTSNGAAVTDHVGDASILP